MLIEEAARIARVSSATLRYWIATKGLRSVRPGRRRMVREDDLNAFLESNASIPRGPIGAPLKVRDDNASPKRGAGS